MFFNHDDNIQSYFVIRVFNVLKNKNKEWGIFEKMPHDQCIFDGTFEEKNFDIKKFLQALVQSIPDKISVEDQKDNPIRQIDKKSKQMILRLDERKGD